MVARKAIQLIDLSSREPVISHHSRGEPFSKKPTVELIGEGPYSFFMLEKLLGEGVNVTDYAVRNKPFGYINPSTDINVRTFTTGKGLSRVVGNADYSVVFSLDLQIPWDVINKFDHNLFNIHSSHLPEFTGVADPIKEMVKQRRRYGDVTVHEVTDLFDRGCVVGQKGFPLNPNLGRVNYSQKAIDTIYLRSVIPAGAELFKEVLDNIKKINPRYSDDFIRKTNLSL